MLGADRGNVCAFDLISACFATFDLVLLCRVIQQINCIIHLVDGRKHKQTLMRAVLICVQLKRT